MSFVVDLTTYVGSNTTLTLDTDLYIGEEPTNSPDLCALITLIPGSYDSESSLERRAVQILAKAKSFVDAEEVAYEIYDLLSNKPGFSGLDDIFYCESINAPYPLDKDSRGRYIFSFNLLISKLPD